MVRAGHLATANGAVALLDNFPSQDSTEVAQAKAHGAIILAHGNMAEWAFTNAISIGSGMPCMQPCQHQSSLDTYIYRASLSTVTDQES